MTNEQTIDLVQGTVLADRCGDLVGALATRSLVPAQQWQHVVTTLRTHGFVVDPTHTAVTADEVAKHARSTSVDAVSQTAIEQWQEILHRLDLAGFKVVRKGG